MTPNDKNARTRDVTALEVYWQTSSLLVSRELVLSQPNRPLREASAVILRVHATDIKDMEWKDLSP